ncbi:hypothetical protein [Chromobacterium haemolyticum]|uniref:hypothetical protein n=1 Tax=Chromobacterium haemolyticum TaxID=394935 RepID=UPI001374A2BE|nr:hypothetical protein [Chromobacterium haemolyticum]
MNEQGHPVADAGHRHRAIVGLAPALKKTAQRFKTLPLSGQARKAGFDCFKVAAVPFKGLQQLAFEVGGGQIPQYRHDDMAEMIHEQDPLLALSARRGGPGGEAAGPFLFSVGQTSIWFKDQTADIGTTTILKIRMNDLVALVALRIDLASFVFSGKRGSENASSSDNRQTGEVD